MGTHLIEYTCTLIYFIVLYCFNILDIKLIIHVIKSGSLVCVGLHVCSKLCTYIECIDIKARDYIQPKNYLKLTKTRSVQF